MESPFEEEGAPIYVWY